MIFLLAIIVVILISSFFLPSYIIQGTIRMASPLLLAGIGGLFSQLAGVLNIALEGLMLFSAFFSIIGVLATGSFFWGTVIGILASLVLSAIFASVSFGLNANVFFAGLATNLFAVSFTTLLQTFLFKKKGSIVLDNFNGISKIDIPFIKSIPVLGTMLSGYTIFIYISWLSAIIAFIIIYKTTFGLRLRAVGQNPSAFRSVGLNPKKYQFLSILISGFACGIAGASISLSVGIFAQNMINNRGWIGLVTIFLGGENPLGIVAASILFGSAEQASFLLKAISTKIPPHFLSIIPYVVTLLAMVIRAQWEKSKSGVIKLKKKYEKNLY